APGQRLRSRGGAGSRLLRRARGRGAHASDGRHHVLPGDPARPHPRRDGGAELRQRRDRHRRHPEGAIRARPPRAGPPPVRPRLQPARRLAAGHSRSEAPPAMTSPASARPTVIEVRDLRTHLVTRWGTVKAVDGVSFAVREGETLGLVGESGSGKSMTCLSIVRLTPRSVSGVLEGTVRLEGDDLLTKSEREMQRIRGRKVAMILQDPMSSLYPVFSIGMQMREPVAAYHGLRGGA